MTAISNDFIKSNSKVQVASKHKPEANPIVTHTCNGWNLSLVHNTLCTTDGWEKISGKPQCKIKSASHNLSSNNDFIFILLYHKLRCGDLTDEI